MVLKLSDPALGDLEDIRSYTVERWGREQWLIYYRGLADALARIEANPMAGRSRDLFHKGMRSLTYSQHVIFFAPIEAADGAVVVLRILHQRRHLAGLAYYEGLDGV